MKISDIIKTLKTIFERKRKNPIQLDHDSNLESNLKPLKVSDKSTPIQISEDTVDVKGSLKVNGTDVATGEAGATELNELSDVTYSSGDLTISSLDKILGSSLELETDSTDIVMDSFRDFNVDAGRYIALDSNSAVWYFNEGGTNRVIIDSSSLRVKERADAVSDTAGFGQIWVHDDSPNNLYFTDDTGQDIAITNNGVIANQKFFYTSSFFHGSTNAEFIPLAGGSTFEQASIIDFTIDDTNFIVPYDLKINTIYANVVKSSSSTADPANTSLKLYKGGSAYSNAVTVNLSSVGFDTTNLHTVYTWDFSGETNTYDAGEVMQIEIDPTSTLQYVSITIAGEYT